MNGVRCTPSWRVRVDTVFSVTDSGPFLHRTRDVLGGRPSAWHSCSLFLAPPLCRSAGQLLLILQRPFQRCPSWPVSHRTAGSVPGSPGPGLWQDRTLPSIGATDTVASWVRLTAASTPALAGDLLRPWHAPRWAQSFSLPGVGKSPGLSHPQLRSSSEALRGQESLR